MANTAKRMVAQTFIDIANALETGSMGGATIALTGIGSEHGEDITLLGAEQAQRAGVQVIYIGTKKSDKVRCEYAECESDAHIVMERLIADGTAQGAVTMHYPFPIGVSTVGRAIAPANGNPVYLATTTGTSSTDRVEGMVRNAVYGIIAAKACGIASPTVGIANIDGARAAESALKKLKENGYDINFAQSQRSDGGSVMRGNDLLTGSADIMVTDPLTGNFLIKMMAAGSTGGSYEASGWGYGPGIGEGYNQLIMIVSRASGAAVISGALQYAAELVRGDWTAVAKAEFEAANAAGLKTVCKKAEKPQSEAVAVAAPPKEVVTGSISGIEVMDLDDAVTALWAAGVYAESGMGCTGPIVLVAESRVEQATEILKKAQFIG